MNKFSYAIRKFHICSKVNDFTCLYQLSPITRQHAKLNLTKWGQFHERA